METRWKLWIHRNRLISKHLLFSGYFKPLVISAILKFIVTWIWVKSWAMFITSNMKYVYKAAERFHCMYPVNWYFSFSSFSDVWISFFLSVVKMAHEKFLCAGLWIIFFFYVWKASKCSMINFASQVGSFISSGFCHK